MNDAYADRRMQIGRSTGKRDAEIAEVVFIRFFYCHYCIVVFL